MASNRGLLTPLPNVPGAKPSERAFFERVKESLEVADGLRGNPLDRKVRVRDLTDAGLAVLKAGSGGQNGTTPLSPTRYVEAVQNPAAPPAPSGLVTFSSIDTVVLTWDSPYNVYDYHSHTNIYRSTEDNFANAVLIAQSGGTIYRNDVPFEIIDTETGEIRKYYYWITFTTLAGREGPPNDPAGTLAGPDQSPDRIISNLENRITRGQLARELLGDIGAGDALSAYVLSLSDQMYQRIAAIQSRIDSTAHGRTVEQVSERTEEAIARTSQYYGDSLLRFNAVYDRLVQIEAEIVDNEVINAAVNRIETLEAGVELLNDETGALTVATQSNLTNIASVQTQVNINTGAITTQSNQIAALQSYITDENGDPIYTAVALEELRTYVDNEVANGGGDPVAEASYTLKLGTEVNGKQTIAGFGIATSSHEYDPGVHSEAIFLVDRFSIIDPSDNKLQFGVENGNIVMPGVNIANGSISSAKIIELDAAKITAGTIHAAIRMEAAEIVGGNLNINNRFIVDGLGRTSIKSADSGGRLEIDDDQIRVYDENDNLRVLIGKLF